jgi:hypothetical protein
VATASAEVPQQLHYNGYLTNAVGEAVDCPDPIQCGDNFDLTFRIYAEEEGGSPIWDEVEPSVSIYGGSFHVILGDANPITADLLDGPIWITVKVNDNAEMLPRQEVASAAYAIKAGTVDYAQNAAQLGGLNPEDFASTESVAELQTIIAGTDDDTLAAMGCAPGQVAKWDGSVWTCADDIDTDTTIADTNTQLTEAEVDAFVANNNYSTGAHTVDTNTQLTEAEVDAFVANNNYSTGAHTVDTNTQLTEAEVDAFVANNGYAAQTELASAQATLTELQTLVNNIDTSTGVDISGLQAQITLLETSIAAIESNLSAETAALQAQITTQAQTIETLGGGTSTLENNIETLENNLALLAFYRASDVSLSKFNMVDQAIDEYVDAAGIDATNSTNATHTTGTNYEGYYWGTVTGVDPYLKLLSHYDGSGQSATDESPSSHTAVFAGSVSQSTSGKRFGSASLYSPGGNGVGWHQWTGTVSDFNTGDGSDWTIDFWIHWNTFNTHNDVLQTRCGIGDNQIGIGVVDSTTRRIYLSNGTTIQAATGVNTGQWYHYEFSRESTGDGNYTLRLFVNGDLKISASTNVVPSCGVDSLHLMSNVNLNHYSPPAYIDELRFSKGIARHTSNFTPPTAAYTISGPVSGDLTLQSVATEAETQPELADLVVLIEDGAGIAAVNTDIKAYVSRDDGANWVQANLVDEGDWNTNKRILVAHNVDISGQAPDKTMRYKITTHNQGASLETRIHATSLAWSF